MEGGVSGLGRGKVMPAVAGGSLFAIGGSFQSIRFFKRASLSCAVASLVRCLNLWEIFIATISYRRTGVAGITTKI